MAHLLASLQIVPIADDAAADGGAEAGAAQAASAVAEAHQNPAAAGRCSANAMPLLRKSPAWPGGMQLPTSRSCQPQP